MRRIIALVIAVMMLLAVMVCFSGCSEADDVNTVTLLNWGEYLDPDLLAEFNEAHDDIKVVEKTVTSNEEMYAILSTEGHGYDLCIPSEYMVIQMMYEGMLAEIDLENIPNFEYVEEFTSTRTFDPTGEYSIPYMCGTVGIVYNTKLVDDEVNSWSILWDEKYKNSIFMYKSVRDSMMVALTMLGYDINTDNPEEIAEARDLLIEQKKYVLAYGTDEIKESMMSGSVALAVDYSGSAIEAISNNPDLAYVVPDEGSNIWVDNIVIMKDTDNKAACEEFINFLCDPEIMARNSEYIGYSIPSDEAIELVDEELSSIPGYIITDEEKARCEYFGYLGDSLELYFDAWMMVLTSN